MQKKILLVFGLLILTHFSWAQENFTSLEEVFEGQANFFDIKDRATAYFENKPELKMDFLFDDNEFIKYKRWEWYWKARIHGDGTFPDKLGQYEIYKSLNSSSHKTSAGSWENINQVVSQGGYWGMGRMISVGFHPTDTNTFYAGGEIGGIWKTTDGGQSWIPLGDELPYAAVGNIVVDHQDPNHIFITIGKNSGWWHYGLGIYETTDGGMNWLPTSRVNAFTDFNVFYKLIMDPTDNQILYSCEEDGLFKSTDAGLTWTSILNAKTIDFEFKPNDVNTIYASSYGANCQVYKSLNAGTNWSQLTNFGSNSNKIAVTDADPNFLAIAVESSAADRVYTSNDAGTNINLKSNDLDDHNMFAISALDKRIMYNGFVNVNRSADTGANWVQMTNWYNNQTHPTVHADNRGAHTSPINPHQIFFVNDGGIYKYDEILDEWTDLTNGIIITQYYKVACGQTDDTYVIGGTQDNGGNQRIAKPNVWSNTNGGDAMEVAVDWENEQTIFTTYWGGKMYRSLDRWDQDTYYEISADTNRGSWVTPYMLEPHNPFNMYAGFADVWKSPDQGDSWIKLSNNLTGNPNNKLEVLDMAPSDVNYIYTGRNNTIYYTTNGGANWLQGLVPTANGSFEEASCLVVHPNDPQTVYVTKTGYGNNSKVYKSTQSVGNWQNITYNIPNVPVNCILIDSLSDLANPDIYLATDVGVFYKQDSDNSWSYYGTGMPNTEVSDLVIQNKTGKLIASTYGRGMWQHDIVRTVFPVGTENIEKLEGNLAIIENPVKSALKISFHLDKSQECSFEIIDINGRKLMSTVKKFDSGSQNFDWPVSSLASGVYFLRSNLNSAAALKFVK